MHIRITTKEMLNMNLFYFLFLYLCCHLFATKSLLLTHNANSFLLSFYHHLFANFYIIMIPNSALLQSASSDKCTTFITPYLISYCHSLYFLFFTFLQENLMFPTVPTICKRWLNQAIFKALVDSICTLRRVSFCLFATSRTMLEDWLLLNILVRMSFLIVSMQITDRTVTLNWRLLSGNCRNIWLLILEAQHTHFRFIL